MTRLPNKPRLNAERDPKVAYAVGRFGAAIVGDVWPLFWTSEATARFGFGRLRTLGVLRTFRRASPSEPKWYSLTPSAIDWVADQTGCPREELRALSGLSRMNPEAQRAKTQLWVSVAIACRDAREVELELVRPEWELRRMRPADVPAVPDMLVVLKGRDSGVERAWMVELDSGSERSFVLKEKALAYRALRGRGPLYGEPRWDVLFVVPTVRRARTVAAAVVEGGAGAFSFIAVAQELYRGRALSRALWTAAEVDAGGGRAPTHALADDLGGLGVDPPQRAAATGAVGPATGSLVRS